MGERRPLHEGDVRVDQCDAAPGAKLVLVAGHRVTDDLCADGVTKADATTQSSRTTVSHVARDGVVENGGVTTDRADATSVRTDVARHNVVDDRRAGASHGDPAGAR